MQELRYSRFDPVEEREEDEEPPQPRASEVELPEGATAARVEEVGVEVEETERRRTTLEILFHQCGIQLSNVLRLFFTILVFVFLFLSLRTFYEMKGELFFLSHAYSIIVETSNWDVYFVF